MPGKNYSYNSFSGKSVLALNKTPAMLQEVRRIDAEALWGTLDEQVDSRTGIGGWRGKCPFCCGLRSKKRSNDKSYLPAYLMPGNQEGYVFHCCSCNETLPTYKFLQEVQGADAAEQYAQARWDAGELCGGGWNCPLPQKVRERLLREKEERRKAYKKAYDEQKTFNHYRKHKSLDDS